MTTSDTATTRRRVTPLVGAALAMALLAACARGPEPLEVGLRRVALDLAFKDAAKAAEVSPRAVAAQLDVADPSLLAEVPDEPEPVGRRPRVIVVAAKKQDPVCVAAPPGAGYDVPTYPLVKDPPAVGTYTRHYTGTVKLSTAAFDLDFPYPPKANVDITDVREVNASSYMSSDDAGSLPPDVRANTTAFPIKVEFRMTRYGPSGLKTVDTFHYSKGGATGGDFLWLVRRETTVNGTTSVFNPTPPIRYVRLFTSEGDDSAVSFSGVDRESQTALAVQSKIVGRESVDVCGEVVDTFRVQIQENFVDLSKQPPVVSGNEGGTFNYWNLQFDHGLLLVREEVHSTYRGSAEIAGAPVPVTVQYDYIGTLDALTPKPLKSGSTTPTTTPAGASEDETEESEG